MFFCILKNKITPNLTPKNFDGIFVNSNKITNKIICVLGKVTKGTRNIKWSFCSRLLRRKYKAKGNSIGFYGGIVNLKLTVCKNGNTSSIHEMMSRIVFECFIASSKFSKINFLSNISPEQFWCYEQS